MSDEIEDHEHPEEVQPLPPESPHINQADFIINDLSQQIAQLSFDKSMLKARIAELEQIIIQKDAQLNQPVPANREARRAAKKTQR